MLCVYDGDVYDGDIYDKIDNELMKKLLFSPWLNPPISCYGAVASKYMLALKSSKNFCGFITMSYFALTVITHL